MKTKKLVLSAVLLAVGLLLHYIVPGIFMGMKPDLLLSMMFVAVIVNEDFKSALVTGLVAGFLTALTTTFPGGQIPNIIDKFITVLVVYGLNTILGNKISNIIKTCIISVLGTLVSGTIFLGSAYLIVGLPTSFTALFLTVVLPATLLNSVSVLFLLSVVQRSMRLVSYSK